MKNEQAGAGAGAAGGGGGGGYGGGGGGGEWETGVKPVTPPVYQLPDPEELAAEILRQQQEQWAAEEEARQRYLMELIPEYQRGGVVPGQVGVPQLALVHGGEQISPWGAQVGNYDQRSVTVNIYGGSATGVLDRFATDPRVSEYFRPRERF